MNCRYITLFFNIVAGIVQTFINSLNQPLYPHVTAACCLPLEPRHDFLLHLIIVIELFPARCFFRWRNEWKSLGAKSGLYGGWSNISHLNFSRSAVLMCTELGPTFLCNRHTLCDNIPLLLFWMVCQSCVKVSQYAAALIVEPGGMKSTRIMHFLSQKRRHDFFQWNWSICLVLWSSH
jgi:hypothetical protein